MTLTPVTTAGRTTTENAKDPFEELRFEGLHRLFVKAGLAVTTADLATITQNYERLQLEDIAKFSLSLGASPELVNGSLRDTLFFGLLCVFETSEGNLIAITPNGDGPPICLRIDNGLETEMPALDSIGRALVFSVAENNRSNAGSIRATIFEQISQYLDGHGPLIAFLTLVSSTLGLALPLFTLAIYDQVLAAENTTILAYVIVGFMLAVVGEFCARMIRAWILAKVSANTEFRGNTRIFSRLLKISHTESRMFDSRLGLTRMRDVETVRNFITGPVGMALIEGPVSIIYFIALAVLGGWLAAVPALVVGGGVMLILVLLAPPSSRNMLTIQKADDFNLVCHEIARRLLTIKLAARTQNWLNRFRDASARLSEADRLRQSKLHLARIISSGLGSLAVTATLGFGTIAVLDQNLTVGALIASVALVWRIMSPVPSMLEAKLRWNDTKNSMDVSQANADMMFDNSAADGTGNQIKGINGNISLSGVTITFQRGISPALRNVSLEITAGETIAITGHSGSGKSVLLDVIAGTTAPQIGTITIDGVSPSHVPPNVLRQSMSYMSRDTIHLPLTIREYLEHADPFDKTISAELICKQMGLEFEVQRLPNRYNTSLCDLDPRSSLGRILSMARAFYCRRGLLLLDEPDAASIQSRHLFMSEIEERRGKSTTIFTTHEPEYLRVADRVLVLNQGMLVRNCAPSELSQKRGA